MSNEKSKPQDSKSNLAPAKAASGKPSPAPKGPPTAKSPAPPPGPRPPLFRRIDWIAFLVTTVLTFIGYYLTLAPDLTLEDSGELATGSFYAGVPHPPGYPVWTIYTWLFTVLVPVSNIAWRVALSSAVAAALSCGLIALLTSRGSSMIIEGIEELKAIERRTENIICLLSGYVAGMLIGFNGYMWSQAVIVEVYPISLLSFMGVLCCLLRWMYAPEQRRYLYAVLFLFGICFTNHQTLILAAMGIEVAIVARDPKLGRDLLFINTVFFVTGLVLMSQGGLESIRNNQMLFLIFCTIGVTSALFCAWLTVTTESLLSEWKPTLIMMFLWGAGAAFYLYMPLASMSNPPMNWGYARTREGFFHALSRGQYEKTNPTTSPERFFSQVAMYADGAKEEFNLVYLAIGVIPLAFLFWRQIKRHDLSWLVWVFAAWAAIRTLVGLRAHETPLVFGVGIIYGFALLLITLVPLIKVLCHKPTDGPEESWLAGLCAIFLCLAMLLMVMLNPSPDRQSTALTKVFFTASHVMLAMWIGYGLALISAALVVHYERLRLWALGGGTVAAGLALYSLLDLERQLPLAVFTAWFDLGLAVVVVLCFALARVRAPLIPLLAVLALMPGYSILSHWSDNEQRGHLFGFWFGHDMFTPPFTAKDGKLSYDPKERAELLAKPAAAKLVYPEMARDAVLFGGTDPGRFCPTYMIFCESFIKPEDRRDPNFDRRDVPIITQNALADATYLMYIRAHYNRSTQPDEPFFQNLLRSYTQRAQDRPTVASRLVAPLDNAFTKLGASIERNRRAGSSYFQEADFTDLAALTAKLKPGASQDVLAKYLFDSLSQETRDLLTRGADERALRRPLARDLNVILERELAEKARLDEDLAALEKREKDIVVREQKKQTRLMEFAKGNFPLYDPARFASVKLSEHVQKFITQDPKSHTRIRLNRLLLEAAYPKELAKSLGGVYPDREIHTPTPGDSQKAFQDYMDDVTKRRALNQLRPGENFDEVRDPASGQMRVSVSGQVAVMGINGVLTKMIFDANPDHEFYVEESFPLEWMYPYLTPFGIIMKINRQPLPELSQEIVDRDHHFWSKFSSRLIGDWITYDTSVSNICAFAERVYKHRDFTGFTGDPAFVRDDDGQKAFSKLRSALAGIYYWRINQCAGRPVEQTRMIKECEFAYKQAFAYCPFSPEAVYRYSNLLISLQRVDDALLVAQTFLKLDPKNASAQKLVDDLTSLKAPRVQAQTQLAPMLAQQQSNPGNLAAAMPLLQNYATLGQTNQGVAVLDTFLTNPSSDLGTLINISGLYGQFGNQARRLAALAAAGQVGSRLMTNAATDTATLLTLAESVYRPLGDHARRLAAVTRAADASERILANPQADLAAITLAAQAFNAATDINNPAHLARLERVMIRLAAVAPSNGEAWYDLAAVQASLKKTNEAIESLTHAIPISRQRLATNPQANNLELMARQDARFTNLHPVPRFQQIFLQK